MPGFRLLACFAHPDDEAFPVGGALATLAARGVEIRLVTATSGEEGEIRIPGAATKETLGAVRRRELACAVRALGLRSNTVMGYRDSGMPGWEANANPKAFIQANAEIVVERLVEEIRRFRPQVVLTFEPGGLYGHPDHMAICRHATEAFRRAKDPAQFRHQFDLGLSTHAADRLFYAARPRGFRAEMAVKLRAAGLDWPLPEVNRANDGVAPEEIHFELDVSGHLEAKLACIVCHRTQVAPEWPYHRVPREVAADILGREHYIRAFPAVQPGEQVAPDFFAGLSEVSEDYLAGFTQERE